MVVEDEDEDEDADDEVGDGRWFKGRVRQSSQPKTTPLSHEYTLKSNRLAKASRFDAAPELDRDAAAAAAGDDDDGDVEEPPLTA